VAERIKFYTDEHVPSAVTKGLRRRGVDVLTARERNLLTASDETQLTVATREGRVIFTQDADFLRLHAQGNSHAGIVYAHQTTPIGVIVRGLMLIYQILEPKDMQDHVEFI
jgi:predicted nuclease of predicted toxin-antitoxin system